MTPFQFASQCRQIKDTQNGHAAHRALDLLTNQLLRELGYGEGIDIFEAAVGRWHAAAHTYPYAERCPDCEAMGAIVKPRP